MSKKEMREMESQLAHLTIKERKSRDIMVVIGECEDDCLIGDYNVVYREV